MKKFAFLIHLRDSYRKDLSIFAHPLGLIPESVYRLFLEGRSLKPFVWSEVRVRPGATEAEGYIIMVPFLARQLLQQQRAVLPHLEQALSLAASKGAEIVGLGALTSPISLGGRLLVDHPRVSITNGNAYTAVVVYARVAEQLSEAMPARHRVAVVGATGSVGALTSALLVRHHPEVELLLVARNERKLEQLRYELMKLNPQGKIGFSTDMQAIRRADIVVLLTSAAECVLQADYLKQGAFVLDGTQPRNAHPSLLQARPDVTIVDGGLVSVPSLRFTRSIVLPPGVSYACLAETMLLALAGHSGHFSIGHPTLEHAEYISALAHRFRYLGFSTAPDYCFGQPLPSHQRPALSLKV